MGGEVSTFNARDGYMEALVRGFRSGFLLPEDYRKLAMCETLEDLRTALEETDYGSFLQDEPAPLAVTTIGAKSRDKVAAEFRHLRSQCNYPLCDFLDMLTHERMIDNVVNLIQGSANQKPPEELLARLDPLGWFPEIKAITAIDMTAGYDELYRTLLVDTPIGPYFEEYVGLQAAAATEADKAGADIASWFNEADLELMRNILKKAWLERFNVFCKGLGGTTGEVMGHILNLEADFRVLMVTVNSLNTALSTSVASLADRNALYPSFGYIYPEGTDKMRKAWNDTTVRAALEYYPMYATLYEGCRGYYLREAPPESGLGMEPVMDHGDQDTKSIEDQIYQIQLNQCELTFEQANHYGLFYAWLKLKEQEIRNIVWMADMISIRRKDKIDQILPIFAPRVPV